MSLLLVILGTFVAKLLFKNKMRYIIRRPYEINIQFKTLTHWKMY